MFYGIMDKLKIVVQHMIIFIVKFGIVVGWCLFLGWVIYIALIQMITHYK